MTIQLNRYLQEMSTFDNIATELIVPSRNSIRSANEDTIEIVESIRLKGLLQPIIVRPVRGKFEIVAGNRRFEACKRLRHRHIKCVVLDLDDKSAFEVSLIENIQRRTLDPFEEARAFKKYCDYFGWGSQSELAKKIGKSQEYVSHRIRLLSLPKEIQDVLVSGQFSVSAAQELGSIKDPLARRETVDLAQKHIIRARELRHVVKACNSIFGDTTDGTVNVTESQDHSSEKFLSEAILIMRISLIRLDGIIEKSKDERLRKLLFLKRVTIHNAIDEFIAYKKFGLPNRKSEWAPRGLNLPIH